MDGVEEGHGLRFIAIIAVQVALVAAGGTLALRGPSPSPEVEVRGYEEVVGRGGDATGDRAPLPVSPVVLPRPPGSAAPPVPLGEAAINAALEAAGGPANALTTILARERLAILDRACGIRADQAPDLARLFLGHAARDLADRAALAPRLRKASAACRGWYRAAGMRQAELEGDLTPALRRIDPELDRLLTARETFEAGARRELRGLLTTAQAAVLEQAGTIALLRR
ncbi:MAG: hypothetical protein MUE73_07755 [Planctomycetes bacterium]|jgi:hypothetical protein|nr:hypothetical protein [Planctomycetota bacterium]